MPQLLNWIFTGFPCKQSWFPKWMYKEGQKGTSIFNSPNGRDQNAGICDIQYEILWENGEFMLCAQSVVYHPSIPILLVNLCRQPVYTLKPEIQLTVLFVTAQVKMLWWLHKIIEPQYLTLCPLINTTLKIKHSCANNFRYIAHATMFFKSI